MRAVQKRRGSEFPKLSLPLPIPFPPMEATRATEVPAGDQWQYEPKWDGFRAIVFRSGDEVVIQSKSGQPLGRYFPELVDAFRALAPDPFVLDGEIVLPVGDRLSFDSLQLRLHPAESRIRKLAEETPAQYFVFDLLVAPGKKKKSADSMHELPLRDRRERLESFFVGIADDSPVKLSPATTDRKVAVDWFDNCDRYRLEGVMAKELDLPYLSGERRGMVKVKHLREADCVVGGYRLSSDGKQVGAIILGLYDAEGRLHHVGHCWSFNAAEKKKLKSLLEPISGKGGFDGKAPGRSRWSRDDNQYIPVAPKLVCEVQYDYFSGDRFRHGTKFLRWRTDKKPKSCTFEQVR